jgi:hypothetical protein
MLARTLHLDPNLPTDLTEREEPIIKLSKSEHLLPILASPYKETPEPNLV